MNAGVVVVEGADQWKLIVNATDSGWSPDTQHMNNDQCTDPEGGVNPHAASADGTCNQSGSWTHFSNRLYNLAQDPREQINLFKMQPKKAAQLAAKLKELSARRYTWDGSGMARGKAINVSDPTQGGKMVTAWFPWLKDDEVP